MLAKHQQINTPKRRKNADTSARQRIWQSMRILRQFTVPDLMATAETSRECVYGLIRPLCKAGIARKSNGRYQLIKNLGPLSPGVRSDGAIFDHNTRKIIPLLTGEDDE